MSELPMLPSEWNEWKAERLIGKDKFISLYLASKEKLNRTVYSSIEEVYIPFNSMLYDGIDMKNLREGENNGSLNSFEVYITNEIDVNFRLRGINNILCYDDCLLKKNTSGKGYLLYARLENFRRLSEMLGQKGRMSEETIIKLAIDMCSALEVLREKNIVHGDIRPENIFVDNEGDCRLGNFGIGKILYRAVGTEYVMDPNLNIAPEFITSKEVSTNADIYSLGLMLYKFLNYNKPPFAAFEDRPLTDEEIKNVFSKKIIGEKLPYPADCSNVELAQIVLKACECDPNERWQNPSAMKRALSSTLEGISKQSDEKPAFISVTESGEADRPQTQQKNTNPNVYQSFGNNNFGYDTGKNSVNSITNDNANNSAGDYNKNTEAGNYQQTVPENYGGSYGNNTPQNEFSNTYSSLPPVEQKKGGKMGQGIVIGFLSACVVTVIVCVVLFAYPGLLVSNYNNTSVNESVGINTSEKTEGNEDQTEEKTTEKEESKPTETEKPTKKVEETKKEVLETIKEYVTEPPLSYEPEPEPIVIETQPPTEEEEDTGLYGTVCYADVEYFLTLRNRADRLSEPLAFVPAMTKMTIICESEINGMLLVEIDVTGDVGYINTNYICYSKDSAQSSSNTSPADQILYPASIYIYLVKEGAAIYDDYGSLIDVLDEDELAYIVGTTDTDKVEILMIDEKLPYHLGYVSMGYLESTGKS